MLLSEILAPKSVRVFTQISSKKRLFTELSEVAALAYGIPSALALDGLQERESLGPTGVGHGIALPHTCLDNLNQVVGVFFRLDKPLDYESVDKKPVDLVFALFAPKDTGTDHLKALALVSRTMREPSIVTKLRSNTNVATLHAILTELPAARVA